MSKKVKLFEKSIITMSFLLVASSNAWAGEFYYRDCEVTVHSPSTAQGLVYVDTGDTSRASFFQSSAPGASAQVKANFGEQASEYGTTSYHCRLFAYPTPGYTLAGFVTKADYLAGKKNNLITNWSVCKSGDKHFVVGRATESEKSENDPLKSSSYSYSTKTKAEFYAIFKPATSISVTVSSPGHLKEELTRTGKAETVSDIVVKGNINEQDISYLRDLVNNHELIRIDLSGAHISVIPRDAFRNCYSLYEFKLPTSGLTKIEATAFYGCHSLKRFTVPSGVYDHEEFHNPFDGKTYKPEIFGDCYSINKGF